MEDCEKAIGFTDSGLGGLSVLKEAIHYLPNENFIYYGDSANAPYGTKSVEEVEKLTMHNVDYLLHHGAKAIVIACNTATSAAIHTIRETYPTIPVIGVEPALKPAVERHAGGNIIIMATTVTLHEEKFYHLMKLHEEEANIIPLPCPGLMDFVERGELESEELHQYLTDKLLPYKEKGVDAIVLGCTHYPFLKKSIAKVIGERTELLDGSLGTSKELKRRLMEKGLLTRRTTQGTVTIYNSKDDPELIRRSYELLK